MKIKTPPHHKLVFTIIVILLIINCSLVNGIGAKDVAGFQNSNTLFPQTRTETSVPITSTKSPTITQTQTLLLGPEYQEHMLAEWLFSGNLLDTSGNNHNGINHGATLTKDRYGKINSAYYFNGNSDYIDCGKEIDFSKYDSFSISMWFNWEKDLGDYVYRLISKWSGVNGPNQIMLSIGPSNELHKRSLVTEVYFVNSGQILDISKVVIETRKWYHLAATYNKERYIVYLNGEVIFKSEDISNSIISDANNVPLLLGSSYTEDYYYIGVIDDVRIYNVELGRSEIIKLFTEG
jgi:hypothetical protein